MVRRDVRMLHDPMRSQFRSLLVGFVLTVLVVAGCAILSFLRPQGAVGDAKIVMGKDSGALFVVVGQRLHPVLNLASARLIVGAAEKPVAVKDSKLSSMPRGPLLGIAGAPSALPGSAYGDRIDWTLCESVQLSASGSAVTSPGVLTTIFTGPVELGAGSRVTAAGDSLLTQRGGKTYLVYDGKKAEVDPKDPAVVSALRLPGVRPRPIGPALLDAALEVPPLRAPAIARAGEPGPGKLSHLRVGAIIRVTGAGRPELFVVLAEGVQRISSFTAELIRNADSQGMGEIVSVPPDSVAGLPVISPLPTGDFPTEIPTILAPEDAPVACVTWFRNGPKTTVHLLAGPRLPLRDSAQPVQLITADGVGDRVDLVYLQPSSGEFVQVTGMEPGSERRESLFYIADNGIRYGVPDMPTAAALGLGTPRLVPWPMIGPLVAGPTLAKQDALVGHDILPSAIPNAGSPQAVSNQEHMLK